MRSTLFVALLSLAATCFGDSWKPYKVGPHLTVDLPAKPVPTEDGTWLAQTDGANYVVVAVKTGAQPDHGALGDFLNGLAANAPTEGKVTSVQDLIFKGWRGMEFRWRLSEIESWGKAFSVDGVLMALQVSYLAGDGAPTGASRFFSSFKPTSAKEGPFKKPGPEFKTYTSKEYGFTVSHHGEPELKKKPLGDHEETIAASTYANRSYLTFAAVAPEEVPAEATEEELQALGDMIAGSILDSLGAKKLKSSAKRAGGKIEITLDARGKMGLGARFMITLAGNVAYVRAFFGPEAMLGSKHVADWFASFKLPS